MPQKRGLLLIILLSALSGCPAQLRTPYQLAFASDRAGNGDIFILDEWGHLLNLTHSPAGDWAPRWSPAGDQIAFTGHQDNQADIWLMRPRTGRRTNLTRHPAWDYAPAWSPDGRAILFVSERDGDAELFIQQIDQTEALQLTFNDYQDKSPSWSPDGGKIAFAAVVNGVEGLYLLDLKAQNTITPLIDPAVRLDQADLTGQAVRIDQAALKGTGPVWSPGGREIAFVGWQAYDQISLYVINLATRSLGRLYTTDRWIGSLSWSADGAWLFFSGRAADNHDLMALNRRTRQVSRLTGHAAWDDFPALRPGDTFSPARFQANSTQPSDPAPGPAKTTQIDPAADDTFGYGVNLADLSNAYLIQDIGFNYIKGFVNWGTVEAEEGHYRWIDPDNILQAAEGARAGVLLRIHGVPPWARPENTPLSHPPANLAHFERFMRAIAARYRGRVAAYEIWNEPNLNYEWGYRPPNPAEYTALLKTAYRAIKAEDPAALVISAGLAPTGEGNPPESLGVLAFIEGMYQAGAKGYFDAMGSHPYTYGRAPDYRSPGEITFDQVDQLHDLMLEHGDGDTPIWITEMGWVLETHWDLGAYHNQGVDQLTQAQYTRRAYEKIENDWPWVEAAFLFNLDFSTAPWYAASNQMRWFAILNPDRTPRPAYSALRQYRAGD